ncbi:MAG: GTPase HflX [Flavobacteriales bacterium]|nr:GTPase HflX [Flavobacteriales bacterium]
MEASSDIEQHIETCVLIGVVTQNQEAEEVDEYLDELEFLATTANAQCVKRFTQNLTHPDRRTFVGTGKMEEIKEYVHDHQVDIVIFDDELSPSQLRNIERVVNPDEFADFKVKILDRNNLILDIFAARARTAHAKTQVELAQYQYLLPRLTNMWTHLSKQKGGIGMKGPGEKEIETDRRIIRDKIALLKTKLTQIDRQMATQRGNRGGMVRVALVGYTNVGKSTIMNMISKSEVFAENKLFATLDTTVRKVVIHNLPFLLADTVGFIRKLPHQLIESFKSTLDETRESDILIHVVDVSHPGFEDQYHVVEKTLAEIGTEGKPTIIVFNKIDQYTFDPDSPDAVSLKALKKTWMAKMTDKDIVFISAIDKGNVEEFKDMLYERVKEIHAKRYPYNNYYF